jgi:hypothetical protein
MAITKCRILGPRSQSSRMNTRPSGDGTTVGYSAKALSPRACCDIGADFISEPSTGTNFVITATDHIRPIATTAAIAIMPVRILLLLASVRGGA